MFTYFVSHYKTSSDYCNFFPHVLVSVTPSHPHGLCLCFHSTHVFLCLSSRQSSVSMDINKSSHLCCIHLVTTVYLNSYYLNSYSVLKLFCFCEGVLPAGSRQLPWRWDPDNFIPDWGYFTPPNQPPRHQRIKMEGNRHPVSGECCAPVQNTAGPRARNTTIDRVVFVCAPCRRKATHRCDASARAWGKKGPS